jgi:hypothetical protein
MTDFEALARQALKRAQTWLEQQGIIVEITRTHMPEPVKTKPEVHDVFVSLRSERVSGEPVLAPSDVESAVVALGDTAGVAVERVLIPDTDAAEMTVIATVRAVPDALAAFVAAIDAHPQLMTVAPPPQSASASPSSAAEPEGELRTVTVQATYDVRDIVSWDEEHSPPVMSDAVIQVAAESAGLDVLNVHHGEIRTSADPDRLEQKFSVEVAGADPSALRALEMMLVASGCQLSVVA